MTMPEMRFDGRVCIITGAGGGLGRHALELARRGARSWSTTSVARSTAAGPRAAQRVVDEITAGREGRADHDSVATAEGGEAIVQAALAAFGRVDVLVNNAGILRDKAFHKMEPDHDRRRHRRPPQGRALRQPASLSADARTGLRTDHQHQLGLRPVRQLRSGQLWRSQGRAGRADARARHGGCRTRHQVNAIAPIASTRMTADILGELATQGLCRSPSSPLVAFLAHEDCSVNGHIYSVAGGRVARILVAETHGVMLPRTVRRPSAPPSPRSTTRRKGLPRADLSGRGDHHHREGTRGRLTAPLAECDPDVVGGLVSGASVAPRRRRHRLRGAAPPPRRPRRPGRSA